MNSIIRIVGLTLLLSSIAFAAGGSGSADVSGMIKDVSSIILKVIYAVAILTGIFAIYSGAKIAFFKEGSDSRAEANTEKGIKIIIFGIICILLPVIIHVINSWTQGKSKYSEIDLGLLTGFIF